MLATRKKIPTSVTKSGNLISTKLAALARFNTKTSLFRGNVVAGMLSYRINSIQRVRGTNLRNCVRGVTIFTLFEIVKNITGEICTYQSVGGDTAINSPFPRKIRKSEEKN